MKRSIELLLLKLADGGRVLRLQEPASGLCLESARTRSIRRAPEGTLAQVFEAMLERELGAA